MAFGRLERSQGAQPMSEINVTPLVDVMLVLVVIFIITAPLLASSIKLDLPRSDAARPNAVPQFVTLVVDKTGLAFLNDQQVSEQQMAQSLRQSATRVERMFHHAVGVAAGPVRLRGLLDLEMVVLFLHGQIVGPAP